jgi:hypothetical protein
MPTEIAPLFPPTPMRRERRQKGLCLLEIELRKSEREGPLRYGWRAKQSDPVEISAALYHFLEDGFG